jgi:hypothetical protein
MEGIPQAGLRLMVLSVNNSGSVRLTGWTTSLSLPAGYDVMAVQNGEVDTSGPSTVRVGNAQRNGALAPGESTEVILLVIGGDRSLDPRGITCSAN